jgi:hypothetical protein
MTATLPQLFEFVLLQQLNELGAREHPKFAYLCDGDGQHLVTMCSAIQFSLRGELEKQRKRFGQVLCCLVGCVTLAYDVKLWSERNEPSGWIGSDNRMYRFGSHLKRLVVLIRVPALSAQQLASETGTH